MGGGGVGEGEGEEGEEGGGDSWGFHYVLRIEGETIAREKRGTAERKKAVVVMWELGNYQRCSLTTFYPLVMNKHAYFLIYSIRGLGQDTQWIDRSCRGEWQQHRIRPLPLVQVGNPQRTPTDMQLAIVMDHLPPPNQQVKAVH